MQISHPVRYGVLALVAALAAGLLWLGVVRYQAEQRALRFAAGAEPAASVVSLGGAPVAPDNLQPGSVGKEGDAGLSVTPVSEPPAVQPEAEEPPAPMLLVHVAGAVANPGVYELEPGARVVDAIEAAGGALPDAEPHSLNLAAPVADGDKVYVYTQAELKEQAPIAPAAQGATHAPVKAETAASKPAAATEEAGGRKVNVNTATAAELEQVPGIGPATARAIVEHRASHGPFRSLDDLEAVRGIGPKTLERLRPHLTI